MPITIQPKGSTIIRIEDAGYTGLTFLADTETTMFIMSGILRSMNQDRIYDINITETDTRAQSVQDTLIIRETTEMNQNIISIIKAITEEVMDVDVAMGTIDKSGLGDREQQLKCCSSIQL